MFFVEKNRADPIRVALVSDTHGVIDPRIADLVSGCDWAVHAGDVGAWDVIAAMRPCREPVIAVRGNNDTPAKWPAGDRERLAELPEQAELALPGGRLAIVHGHRHGAVRERHRRLREGFSGARAIVYGHSHRLVCDTEAEPWVLNPGAAGRSRTYGGPSCLILTVKGEQWSVESARFAATAKTAKRTSP